MNEESIRNLIIIDEEINKKLKKTYGIDLLNDHITGYNFYSMSNSVYLSFVNKNFKYLLKNIKGHSYFVKVYYDECFYLPISLKLISTEDGKQFRFPFEYGTMNIIVEADEVNFDPIRLVFNLGGITEED